MIWKRENIKDLTELFTDGDWIETKNQSVDGIRLIQTGNIGFGKFKPKEDKKRFISLNTFEKLKCKEIYPGDILTSRLPDPVGKSCIIPDVGERMITGVDCSIIRLKPHVDKVFFAYYQMSNEYLNEVNARVTGTTRSRISRKNLGQIKVPIPPLQEQKQIVETLDKAFEKIDKAIANIERNIENAERLFLSKLEKIINFIDHNSKASSLGEVTSLFQGLAINKKTKHLIVKNSSLPLLRIKDLKNNTNEYFVSEQGFPPNALVNKSEIIYTRTGNSLGLVFRGRHGVLHNNSFKILPKKELENDYLFWWLQSEKFKSKIIRLASKAAQPDITHKLFKEQKIIVPKREYQLKSSKKIEKLNKLRNSQMRIYFKKKESLLELKKSILEKAFKGELTSAA